MTLRERLKGFIAWDRSFKYRGGDPQQEPHEPFNPRLEDDEEFVIPLAELPEFNLEGGIVSGETLRMLRQTPADPNTHSITGVSTHSIDIHMEAERGTIGTRIQISRQDVDNWHSQPKKPLMDRKYPHICYECEKPIQYKHAHDEAKIKHEKYTDRCSCKTAEEWRIKRAKEMYDFEKQFRKMWKSKYFRFFCCNCFRTNEIQEKYFKEAKKQPTKCISLDDLERELEEA